MRARFVGTLFRQHVRPGGARLPTTAVFHLCHPLVQGLGEMVVTTAVNWREREERESRPSLSRRHPTSQDAERKPEPSALTPNRRQEARPPRQSFRGGTSARLPSCCEPPLQPRRDLSPL